MQSQNNAEGPPSDPAARLMRAPGTIFRLVGLVLGIAALFTPAFSRIGYDVAFHIDMTEALPYAVALPIAASAALLASAIPQVAAYTRLLDIVVAVIGIVLCIQLLGMHSEGTRAVSSANRLSIGGTGPRAAAGLEMGFWLIAGSVAAFALAALRLGRRYIHA